MTTTIRRSAHYHPFEKELCDIDAQIDKLRDVAETYELDLGDEMAKLLAKRDSLLTSIYSNLTPWQRVQVARSPDRPQARDYIEMKIGRANV